VLIARWLRSSSRSAVSGKAKQLSVEVKSARFADGKIQFKLDGAAENTTARRGGESAAAGPSRLMRAPGKNAAFALPKGGELTCEGIVVLP
jgi:hypothetical protein